MVKAHNQYRIAPGGALTGEVTVPGDKSISHRAVMFSAIANGASGISGLLESTDVLRTIAAFEQMGVCFECRSDGLFTVAGVGRNGLNAPKNDLDMGNSGTAMRLLSGLLAGQSFCSRLVGDDSLSNRPMLRVAKPLALMGAKIETQQDGTPPLLISPTDRLQGIRYALPVPSAQVKSALLVAGIYAQGTTIVIEPEITRDHTERMLNGFGYQCERLGSEIKLHGFGELTGRDIEVPGDLSSAAFFIVGACIAPESNLCIKRVGVNPTRFGVVDILRQMGANISLINVNEVCGEPVADIELRSAPLHGIEMGKSEVSLAIDELPVLCIAAACAEGVTTIRGAEELRHKESDRISAMVIGLRNLGVEVEEFSDGLKIRGGMMQGGVIDSFGDHRIAMAFAVAGLRVDGEILINDCANVGTSFPGFIHTSAHAGLRIDATGY